MPKPTRRDRRRARRARRKEERRAFRLTVINVWAKNDRKRDLKRVVFHAALPHAVAATEAHTLGGVAGYRRLSGHGRRGGEVAIYVRLDKAVQAWWTRKVTREGRGYVNERHVVDAVIPHAGVAWVPIGLHANPGHHGLPAELNEKLLDEVEDLARFHAADGRQPIPVGDFNRGEDDRGEDTPHHLARRLDHETHMVGIDGITAARSVDVEKRAFDVPGSNHPGIRFRLVDTRDPFRGLGPDLSDRTDPLTKES